MKKRYVIKVQNGHCVVCKRWADLRFDHCTVCATPEIKERVKRMIDEADEFVLGDEAAYAIYEQEVARRRRS